MVPVSVVVVNMSSSTTELRSASTSLGGSPWSWARTPRETNRALVTQQEEFDCGLACAEILFRDRGISVSSADLRGSTPLPARAEDLAESMNRVHPAGPVWSGGALNVRGEVSRQLVVTLCLSTGTWAALLEPLGFGRVGHWVVIDGIDDESMLLVRDPVGEAYRMTFADFASLWRYTVLVFEEPGR